MNLTKMLIGQVSPSNIEGLSIEMKEFFLNDGFVESFELEYSLDNESYIISCIVSELDLTRVKSAFMRFLNFIQYSRFTFYMRSKTEKGIEYELISGSDDAACFYCRVVFSQG